jgi:hypothetical protein
MRSQGFGGALFAIAVGAILTYAVSFTISGISIHIVGVIIMVVGAVALAILLIRAVSGSRRRSRPVQIRPGLGADGSYAQDPARVAAPVAATRVTTEVYPPPGQRAAQSPGGTEGYRAPGTPQR